VTGAIPIRRNSKDPVYLVTLRAYIAEILRRRDLLYYAEGGRSYSGELKQPKTGLLQAALLADRAALSVVPMAISYDLVLEDRVLAREAIRRRARPFTQEVAELVRHAVGYHSRAFVTFSPAIPLGAYDPESRRDLVTLAHKVHDAIGLSYKVLPTALVAAVTRPQITRTELTGHVEELLAVLAAEGANVGVKTARQVVEEGVERLTERGVIVEERQRIRVRDRIVLRYYTRTIQHLLHRPRRTTH
jgi:glycerol-3-phosphate O-acyltransferase